MFTLGIPLNERANRRAFQTRFQTYDLKCLLIQFSGSPLNNLSDINILRKPKKSHFKYIYSSILKVPEI